MPQVDWVQIALAVAGTGAAAKAVDWWGKRGVVTDESAQRQISRLWKRVEVLENAAERREQRYEDLYGRFKRLEAEYEALKSDYDDALLRLQHAEAEIAMLRGLGNV